MKSDEPGVVVRYFIRKGVLRYNPEPAPLPERAFVWKVLGSAIGAALVMAGLGVNQIWFSGSDFLQDPITFAAGVLALGIAAIIVAWVVSVVIRLRARSRRTRSSGPKA